MRKTTKIILAVLAVVLVAGGLVLSNEGGLFQGKFFIDRPVPKKIDFPKLYLHRNRVVSAVASPVTSAVPSVVVSGVTSRAGTSQVASVVVSAVTSSIASAVAVEEKSASGIDTKKLKKLTEKLLKTIEKEDYAKNKKKYEDEGKKEYKANPDKFTLSQEQKNQLIDLFKTTNPSKFIFRPISE
jgi:hypothetical protein